jgi:hypothetical protein
MQHTFFFRLGSNRSVTESALHVRDLVSVSTGITRAKRPCFL